ncbi:unnamed protein product [Symbiodinium natans]|uniref:Pentatricopeptide repeat-containing protein, chloroplastic n=1 Tax=Symbiodinium natans TaxID=878477 RepID=A0A812HWB9_9DINO|nr:unnamed protein product [Symbiodinium natans]
MQTVHAATVARVQKPPRHGTYERAAKGVLEDLQRQLPIDQSMFARYGAQGPGPKETTYLLRKLAREGGRGIAEKVFVQLRQMGCEVNVFHFNTLLAAHAAAGSWLRCCALLGEMASRTSPDIYTYGTLVNACEKGSAWIAALGVLVAMESGRFRPDTVTCNSAISACEKSGEWAQALGVLREMIAKEVQIDTVSCSAVISACEKASQWDWALHQLGRMRELSIESNAITHSAAISACEVEDAWPRAVLLFDELRQAGAELDTFSWTALLCAFEKGQRWQESLQVLQDMPSQDALPTLVTYNSALLACAHGKQWRMALQILSEQQSHGLELDSISFYKAMDACSAGSEWERALRLLEDMMESNIDGLKVQAKPCYDHQLQAGSALDCFKHLVLASLLERMAQEPQSFTYADTHAGWGLYDLSALEVTIHQNHLYGITALVENGKKSPQCTIQHFLTALRSLNGVNGEAELRRCLGSPGLALRWLRPQDKAVFFEVASHVHAALQRNLQELNAWLEKPRVEVLRQNSYTLTPEAISRNFQGRGLVLIDSPYEPYTEYLAWNLSLLRSLRRSWPSSCVAVWYPAFNPEQTTSLYHRAKDLQVGDVLVAEMNVTLEGSEALASSGVLLVNAPPEIENELGEMLSELGQLLSLKQGTAVTSAVFWL